MLSKPRKIIIAVLFCFSLTVVGITLTFREDEPRYKGKPLSNWLARYREAVLSERPFAAAEAEAAIKAIGTNAVPYLLKWLQYRESKEQRWKVDRLRALPAILTRNPLGEWLATDSKETRSLIAMFGFRPLRDEAAATIPELAQLATLTDREDDYTARRAIYALASFGDSGVPTLVAALTNSPSLRRVLITEFLGDERFFGTNRSTRVPPLLKCLDDEDHFVAMAAATSLGKLAAEPDVVVPALQRASDKYGDMVRLNAIEALGRFGGKARSATPLLINALSSKMFGEAEAATNALRQVAPEVLTNALTR